MGDILYIDGFAMANSGLLEEEGEKAKAVGMKVAIDLGSKFLVESHRPRLLDGIRRYCDFVFANEDEFKSLAGSSVEDGCRAFADFGCSFIVKRGERGAVHCRQGQILESPVRAQLPFDETGSGDAFAAGYLAGVSRGFSPERCLRLGNRIAEEAIAVPGLGIDPARIGTVLAAAGL
jgi:sugar/nucleoside kinase (ribokinase family)